MIVSVNWLKKFTSIDLAIDELTALIGTRLVEIEEVVNLNEKYKDVVIGRVVDCRPLVDSDHLNVVRLDDGGVTPGMQRDDNGHITVVCGAPNVREGLSVAWLPPGSTVPATFASSEPFKLATRMIRGVNSNGMIASAKELDLFDDHAGILELDKDPAAGTKFAEAYELDDYLLRIENKSLTHRPDAFGIIGFAREVAAIQGKAFETPDWLTNTATPFFEGREPLTLSVTVDDAALSDKYRVVVLAGANAAAQSPLKVQTYLSRVGVRPINAVVDATNYLMMLTGQPLHAFDYDKVLMIGGGQADIHVRSGRAGEKLKLLDNRVVELDEADIVIAVGDTAIGLAGAMGGSDTEIDENTKRIILESATFNLYNLRATQMRHGIFSEAITRFTKGQPAALTAPVLAQAVRMMEEFAGASPVTPVVESYSASQDSRPSVMVTVDMVNAVLGSKFSAADITETLGNVEFIAELKEPLTIKVTPPYWRADVAIPEDVIEEVGRLNGFDSIEAVLPSRDFTAIMPGSLDNLRQAVRRGLARGGANEVLTYSFVHGDILKKAGQKPEDSYRLTNSLSPELQYYRQTLTPSLLSLIHPNLKSGYERFALFEINKAHNKSLGLNEENVPTELDLVAFTIASKQAFDGAAFFEAKAQLDNLARALGLTLTYMPFDQPHEYFVAAPFEPKRSAYATDAHSGEVIGIVGEYKKPVARGFKLPDFAAGFELRSDALLLAVQSANAQYTPLSRYPSLERDICFKVNSGVAYAEVAAPVEAALESSGLETNYWPIDIYQPADKRTRNFTFRIKLTASDRTLTSQEAAAVMGSVARAVSAETSAIVV